MAATVDQLVRTLGNPGRYQALVLVLLCFNYVPVAVNHLIMVFHGFAPEHNCRLPDQWPRNASLPLRTSTAGTGSYDQCSMFIEPTNHSWGVKECIYGYEFHTSDAEWTVTSEWGLVCDRKYLVRLITSLYFVGVTVGGLVFGVLADRFGRQPIMLLCLYVQLVLGVGLYFVRRLLVFISLRVLQGFFIQGLQTTSYAMAMELVSPAHRSLAGCAVELFWGIGIVLLAVAYYFVQHWRYVQLAVSIPTLVTVLYIWLIPESLRWLITRGQAGRARAVAIRIASYNGVRLNADMLERLEKLCHTVSGQAERRSRFTDLFRTPTVRRNWLVLSLVWFTISLTYYGVSFNVSDLSGNRFFNFMIGGALEVAAFLLTYVALSVMGRRALLSANLLASGTLLMGTVAAQKLLITDVVDVPTLITALALLGKAFVVSAFATVFLVTSEVFPTVVRSLAMGSCIAWSRVGSLVAPQVLLLGDITFGWVPFVVFGCLALTAGLLVLLLPETRRLALPDTVHQAETITNHRADDLTSDVGYGNSPRWIVQDGLIVSRPVDEPLEKAETSSDESGKRSDTTLTADGSSPLRLHVNADAAVYGLDDCKQRIVLCDIDETRL